MKDSRSHNLFSETEKIGESYNLDTHKIIADRYHYAAELSRGLDALEVGCGSGIGLEYLSNSAKSLSALEYSKENIRLLKKQDIKYASIYEGDAQNMPFEDQKFELIIALAMIYYLSINKFLEECSRVLKDRGILFFCTSNKDVPGFCAAPYTTKYHSIPELNNILKNYGYDVEFFGTFPKSRNFLFVSTIRAWIKDILKNIFFLQIRESCIGKDYEKISWQNLPITKKIHNGKYFIH